MKTLPTVAFSMFLMGASSLSHAQLTGALFGAGTTLFGNAYNKVFGDDPNSFKPTSDADIDRAVENHCGDMSPEQKAQCRAAFERMRPANDRLIQMNRENAQAAKDRGIMDGVVEGAVQGVVAVEGSVLQAQGAAKLHKAGVVSNSDIMNGVQSNSGNVNVVALPPPLKLAPVAVPEAQVVLNFTNFLGLELKNATHAQVQEVLAKNGMVLKPDVIEQTIESPNIYTNPTRLKIAFAADAQNITKLIYEYDKPTVKQIRALIVSINGNKQLTLVSRSQSGGIFRGVWKTADEELVSFEIGRDRGVVSYAKK